VSAEVFESGFLGMAVGDALAAPAQGLKPARIIQLFGRLEGYLDPDKAFAHTPSHFRLKGLYSLPTQEALCVAESLITTGHYDLNDIRDTFLALGQGEGALGSFRGIDEAFRKALQNLKEGKDLTGCGIPHPGIGAIPRVLPLAIFFRDDPEALKKAVIECVLLSHNDPRAIGGAMAYAWAAARFSKEGSAILDNPSDFMANLVKYVRKGEECLEDDYKKHVPQEVSTRLYYTMSESLDILLPCLRENNPDLVKQTILAEANRHAPPFPINMTSQDFAPSSVIYCLYIALSAKAYGTGVLDTIHEGKEACALAALAGGLLGLRFGPDEIPEEWKSGLLNAEQIELRGREMHHGFPDWGERTDLVTMEKRYTDVEREEIRKRMEAFQETKEREERKHPQKTRPASSVKEGLPPQEEAPFAPPPSVVFGSALPDPIQAKKDKSLRGRKRIEWKEDRRKGIKKKKKE